MRLDTRKASIVVCAQMQLNNLVAPLSKVDCCRDQAKSEYQYDADLDKNCAVGRSLPGW